MSKIYTPPSVTAISAMPESRWRALLAPLLLMPPSAHAADRWLYRAALATLFTAECHAALQSLQCFQQKLAGPQRYYTDLSHLVSDLLIASHYYLRPRGFDLSMTFRGGVTYAAVCPRYLQLGLTALLRSALQKGNAARITVDTARFSFCIRGSFTNADLTLPRAVAILHGGTLLQCDDTVMLAFRPDAAKTAYPRWHSSGIDGLLHDPLSCIRTAFITLQRFPPDRQKQ